ncbi:hypothetical protein LJK87_07040 [Paenibacillus sp. P25]|nr:hypothetical protein LJK87_07040 [Paenibacillus sp. P25]
MIRQTHPKASRPIRGRIEADRNTKSLVQRMKPGSIALIAHDDLDSLAAESLLRAKVRAVVNAGRTLTGKLPLRAALLLLQAGVPIFEIEERDYSVLAGAREAVIHTRGITTPDGWIPCRPFTRERWVEVFLQAQGEERKQLSRFIENTLHYAANEKHWLTEPLHCEGLQTELSGKHVLIVIRGIGYRQDLAALTHYINKKKPVLIGVDGGADALLEYGYRPDIIIGDMDSVSDEALQSGAEPLVHSYMNGLAPGLGRIRSLGLKALTVASGGTSEDLALMLAYDQQCELIVTVGLHSHMMDFMEKGRPGMGSNWLVRMKVGSRLVDARGISQLYPVPSVGKGIGFRSGWTAFVKSLF